MISITLPSLYPEACLATLANIEQTTKSIYEVIVVSTLEVRGPNVRWIEETESKGCAHAHHVAAQAARGDYLVPFADDHEFVDGWDEVAIENFERRYINAPFALGLRGAHSAHCGSNFGILYNYFPMMRRNDVARIGWIGPDYQAGFGDSDLSMRVWSAEGRCEWSELGLLRPTLDDKRKISFDKQRSAAAYSAVDLELFLDRWAPIYGVGWNINNIDDFNIDFRPEDNQHLIEGNSLYQNNPSFIDRINRMS